jgi:NAD(P)-dependent dehydrogenase (short-subunit alcohol dehydrogenase family)
VVNDLGGSSEGDGADVDVASMVAEEIVAAGGDAIADTSDVATGEGARALVETAAARFGSVDVLINNAGIIRWVSMPDVDEETLARHWAVHVAGSFHTTRAAWPRLVERKYGRIVMTTSSGIFGLTGNLSYATAKAGVIGLTRSLATEGAVHGITVNAIAPAAFTRMAAGTASPAGAPELVAPLAAFLAHESCPVSGEVFLAGFGRFARLFLAMTEGYVADGEPTVEDVADHWDAISDERGYSVPADLDGWSAAFLRHLKRGS